jgi:AAA domain-containing protein
MPVKDVSDLHGELGREKLLPAIQSNLVAVDAEAVRGLQTSDDSSWIEAIDKSIVSSSELESLNLQPRKKLLDEWFCEGDLGFIFAVRGVGKTWLGLLIARALSEGEKLGDWQVKEPVKVVFIDGEMPPDLMRDRDKGLQRAPGEVEFLNHEILFERTGKVLNITEPEVQRAITEHCIREGVKVVILDNLSTLASGMKENDSFAWEMVNNWLLDFRRHKIAVVLVHHAGRSGEARGTSKREDAAFWVMALDDAKTHADDKHGARFISRFTKPSRNTPDEVPPYEWHIRTDTATGQITVTHKPAQSMDVFLKIIEDGVTDCTQIAQELKVSPATVSRLAKKAIDAGRLRKNGREYELIQPEADK